MKREILPTPEGSPTIRIDGRYLHSRYAPRQEAERLATRVSIEAYTRILIVAGEGLPYFSRAIAQRHPTLTVLTITIGGESPLSVTDSSPGRLRRLLRGAIHPLEVATVQLHEWAPAADCAPELHRYIQTEVVAALEDLKAELATVASFGRLWLKNALRRTLAMESRLEALIRGGALLLVAGGPGVSIGIDRIRGLVADGTAVVAVSSASEALAAAGIPPALLFHTDAGMWAQRYLRLNIAPPALPLRASASPGSSRYGGQAVLFRHGWIGEALAPDNGEWPFYAEAPTVAATMLSAMNSMAPVSPLYLAGFDLCSHDLWTHARPHPNDSFIQRSASRLQPEQTIRAIRAGALEEESALLWPEGTAAFRSRALRSFEDPIKELVVHMTGNRSLQHITPSPVWHDTPLSEFPIPREGSTVHLTRINRPNRAHRREHARTVLGNWQTQVAELPGKLAEMPLPLRDLLLHLAPLETLKLQRGDTDSAALSEVAGQQLTSLARIVNDG